MVNRVLHDLEGVPAVSAKVKGEFSARGGMDRSSRPNTPCLPLLLQIDSLPFVEQVFPEEGVEIDRGLDPRLVGRAFRFSCLCLPNSLCRRFGFQSEAFDIELGLDNLIAERLVEMGLACAPSIA